MTRSPDRRSACSVAEGDGIDCASAGEAPPSAIDKASANAIGESAIDAKKPREVVRDAQLDERRKGTSAAAFIKKIIRE